MPLVNHGAADGGQRRKDRQENLRVDRLQHSCLQLGKIGLPGVPFVRGAGVIRRPLLLNEGSGVQVLRRQHFAAACWRPSSAKQGRPAAPLRLHLGHLLSFSRVQEIELLDFAVRGSLPVELFDRRVRLFAAAFWVLASRYWPMAVRQSGEMESEVSIMASCDLGTPWHSGPGR